MSSQEREQSPLADMMQVNKWYTILRYVAWQLDAQTLCRLCQVSKEWNEFASSDVVWGRLCDDELADWSPDKTKGMPHKDVYRCLTLRPRVGECLQVVDTYNISSVCRVIAKADEDRFCIYYEGWEACWTMWVHRVHDIGIILPITSVDLPGVGRQTGLLEENDFHRKVEEIRTSLFRDFGVSNFRIPGSRRKPFLYTATNTCTIRIPLSHKTRWELLNTPVAFKHINELAPLHVENPKKYWDSSWVTQVCGAVDDNNRSFMTAEALRGGPEVRLRVTGVKPELMPNFDVAGPDPYPYPENPYPDNSNICAAATHAGLVKPGEHALVFLTPCDAPAALVRAHPLGAFRLSIVHTDTGRAPTVNSEVGTAEGGGARGDGGGGGGGGVQNKQKRFSLTRLFSSLTTKDP